MNEGTGNDAFAAWRELDDDEYARCWDEFHRTFDFRPGVDPTSWPAITEPSPSVTYDLSVVEDGPARGAANTSINAEALRCFVSAIPEIDELIVLDWQHPGYRFTPAAHALDWHAEWAIPVYPDGDYYAFLTPDFEEGTFGHPWEQTLCVMGERLIDSLGRSLAGWLPIKRINGVEP